MNDASLPASANAALHVARFLAAPAATMPRFAADGRLWFLCDAPGSAQVFELKPGLAGPPVQRSVHRDAVTVLSGSAAFDFAVFARDAGGDERHQLHVLPAIGEPRALTDDPGTIHGWGAISPDGTHITFVANNRVPAHTDPWVLELASGTARRVAMVQGPHELPCWHPSGQAIVIESAPRSFESTLLLANVHSGAITPLTPHTGDWRHTGPRWRKDGAAFWLRTDRDREFLGVAMMEPG